MIAGFAAQSEAIDIQCTNPPGDIDCEGTLTWNDGTSQLTVFLENTGTDGDITAIALNFPGTFTDVTLTSGPTGWVLGLDGMQDFEFGAENTTDGLDPGESGTFVWTFTGVSGSLTSEAFVADANKEPGDCNTTAAKVDAWGCIHVQRTNTQAGSEFVQLAANGTSVPEPGTLMLLGTGLLGLGFFSRRLVAR